MKDVTAPEHVEVLISEDGKTLWINVEGECAFRACRIANLIVHDEQRTFGQLYSHEAEKHRKVPGWV